MLEDVLDYYINQTHITACLSLAGGTTEQVVTAMGGGVHEHSLYDLASLTKLFTGMAVMRLREEGLLDLTRPVTAYVPQFTELSGITVDQVLGFEVPLLTPERVDAQKTPKDGLRQLFAIRPGDVSVRAYSDMHAMVLRYVIEGAARQDYMDVLQSRILRPLGMTETFQPVPEERRGDCVSFDREHRIERGQYILREGIRPGIPHDPKARLLWPEPCGHSGLFSTLPDMVKFCQGVLRGDVLSRESLRSMARNRTGRRRDDGTWTQFLGSQCYIRHPDQYYSEIPVYESDQAIGVSGFTGHHLSVDPELGVFALFLGNRVLNRLTVLIPEPGKTYADYGLNPDGTGQVDWPDGTRVWSSVNFAHHRDEHFHASLANAINLRAWQPPAGCESPSAR